jgi:hypothetical protein
LFPVSPVQEAVILQNCHFRVLLKYVVIGPCIKHTVLAVMYLLIVFKFMIVFLQYFFRPGLKRPAAQPEEFRGRGRGFTPQRYDFYFHNRNE